MAEPAPLEGVDELQQGMAVMHIDENAGDHAPSPDPPLGVLLPKHTLSWYKRHDDAWRQLFAALECKLDLLFQGIAAANNDPDELKTFVADETELGDSPALSSVLKNLLHAYHAWLADPTLLALATSTRRCRQFVDLITWLRDNDAVPPVTHQVWQRVPDAMFGDLKRVGLEQFTPTPTPPLLPVQQLRDSGQAARGAVGAETPAQQALAAVIGALTPVSPSVQDVHERIRKLRAIFGLHAEWKPLQQAPTVSGLGEVVGAEHWRRLETQSVADIVRHVQEPQHSFLARGTAPAMLTCSVAGHGKTEAFSGACFALLAGGKVCPMLISLNNDTTVSPAERTWERALFSRILASWAAVPFDELCEELRDELPTNLARTVLKKLLRYICSYAKQNSRRVILFVDEIDRLGTFGDMAPADAQSCLHPLMDQLNAEHGVSYAPLLMIAYSGTTFKAVAADSDIAGAMAVTKSNRPVQLIPIDGISPDAAVHWVLARQGIHPDSEKGQWVAPALLAVARLMRRHSRGLVELAWLAAKWDISSHDDLENQVHQKFSSLARAEYFKTRVDDPRYLRHCLLEKRVELDADGYSISGKSTRMSPGELTGCGLAELDPHQRGAVIRTSLMHLLNFCSDKLAHQPLVKLISRMRRHFQRKFGNTSNNTGLEEVHNMMEELWSLLPAAEPTAATVPLLHWYFPRTLPGSLEALRDEHAMPQVMTTAALAESMAPLTGDNLTAEAWTAMAGDLLDVTAVELLHEPAVASTTKVADCCNPQHYKDVEGKRIVLRPESSITAGYDTLVVAHTSDGQELFQFIQNKGYVAGSDSVPDFDTGTCLKSWKNVAMAAQAAGIAPDRWVLVFAAFGWRHQANWQKRARFAVPKNMLVLTHESCIEFYSPMLVEALAPFKRAKLQAGSSAAAAAAAAAAGSGAGLGAGATN